MPDDPHRPPILDDVEQSAVRALAADALGAWLDPIDGNPESTTVNDRKRETLLDGAVDAVAQFYEGRPDETIRQASVATSLVLWLDRDPHMLADVLAASVVRHVRDRRRSPIDRVLDAAGEVGAAMRAGTLDDRRLAEAGIRLNSPDPADVRPPTTDIPE